MEHSKQSAIQGILLVWGIESLSWHDDASIGVRYHHPAHDQVEEEHGVHGQGLPLGAVGVSQEHHRGKGAPYEAGQNYYTPEMKRG